MTDDVDVDLDESDLRIDTYRASGAGGQHVNKTDSAVRITHLPTGIVVQIPERALVRARTSRPRCGASSRACWSRSRSAARRSWPRSAAPRRQADFGSQIRSYVLHPYQLVKDHRTQYETGNTQAVLDGDLDDFVHEDPLAKAAGKVV